MERGDVPAWFVLTFREGVSKAVAVRRMGAFIRRLRKMVGHFEYAATFELTRRGRLHINLLLSHWRYVPANRLRALWGARLSVNRIRDAEGLSREAAGAYSVEALAGYLAKLQQAVPRQWGRRASFSRNWPRLPEPETDLPGVKWEMVQNGDAVEYSVGTGFYRITGAGWYRENDPDGYCSCWPDAPP